MSANKEKPHVLVLPEDDANSELANGFALGLDPNRMRQLQVLPVAGGRMKVLDTFEEDHCADLERVPSRFLVLLMDFDKKPAERLAKAKERIPAHLGERVFILGAFDEPEHLKASLGSLEEIGTALANDCRDNETNTWGDKLLEHNLDEVNRLGAAVRSILFG